MIQLSFLYNYHFSQYKEQFMPHNKIKKTEKTKKSAQPNSAPASKAPHDALFKAAVSKQGEQGSFDWQSLTNEKPREASAFTNLFTCTIS